MPDLLRQALYLGFVLFIISSVWALGWARSINDRIDDHWMPPSPELSESQPSDPFHRVGRHTPPPVRELVTSTHDPVDR